MYSAWVEHVKVVVLGRDDGYSKNTGGSVGAAGAAAGGSAVARGSLL